jgi:hypothetical protein
MKKLILILLCLPMIGFGQDRINLDEMEVRSWSDGGIRFYFKGVHYTGDAYKNYYGYNQVEYNLIWKE